MAPALGANPRLSDARAASSLDIRLFSAFFGKFSDCTTAINSSTFCCGVEIVTTSEHPAVFPAASSAVQTTTVVPTGKPEPLGGMQATDTWLEQRSPVVGG